jgi:hypothetical protein
MEEIGPADHADPDAGSTMRDLYAALAALAREAADLCDPAARAVAMRFPPHMRLWLYGRLVDDATGRLAQLATVCPGALTFAFALENAGAVWAAALEGAGSRLVADAIAGRRLGRALNDAVGAWATGAERLSACIDRADPVWERVWSSFGQERKRLLDRQLLLIRRAGPMVASTSLFLPPPIAFAPEDIPRAVRDNARWFAITKCSRLLLAAPESDSRARLEGLSAFVSRTAPELARLSGRGTHRALLESIRDYAVATGRWPVRASSARHVVEETRRWHERIALARQLHDVRELCPAMGGDPDAPLARPPIDAWREGPNEIAPVATVRALLDEGGLMQNCVSSMWSSVAHGDTAIYHATIHGTPLTVAVRRAGNAWKIVEAKRNKNREPTAEDWTVLRRWETQLA